ncbi:hypothetical protein FWH09_01360 [Candidatus Saccharibacteria bacterium]|nr:hypothetical protein [Candidatus Saccharibacteria bacterium]
MFEINLIPNVKLQLLRMQKLRNMVIFYSVIVAAAVVGVIVILLLVLGGEKIASNTMTNTINREFADLSSRPGINEVLTLQNQMENIDILSNDRKILSRIFAFLDVSLPGEDTPYYITLSSINYSENTGLIVLEGQSRGGFPALDALVKTIERVGYRYVPDFDNRIDSNLSDEALRPRLEPAIGTSPSLLLDGDIVINETSFGRNADGGLVLRFNISFSLDRSLFDFNRKHVVVEGPTKQIVTDSYVQIRDNIFANEAEDCLPDDAECLAGGR